MSPLLNGIRILEIGTVVMAPYAGQILGDLGCEVIKIEQPSGDIARAAKPRSGDVSALFAGNNRNKKSVALDLSTDDGKRTVTSLISKCDVLLHNLREKAALKLGVDFESAKAANPDIIYCATTGFGSAGRYAGRPALDDIVQAASGIASIAASGEGPAYVPTNLADKVAGLHAVYAILAALLARSNGRTGAVNIEVPMFEVVTSFLLNEHLGAAAFAKDGKPGYPRILEFDRRPYRTKDGWIAVIPYTGAQWRRFLEAAGRSDVCATAWFQDAELRQARLAELYGILSETLCSQTTAHWLEILTAADVPCAPVNSLDDVLLDPHLADIGFFDPPASYPADFVRVAPQPVRFGGMAQTDDLPPPSLGQHSVEVLRELGFGDDELDRMQAEGIVHQRKAR